MIFDNYIEAGEESGRTQLVSARRTQHPQSIKSPPNGAIRRSQLDSHLTDVRAIDVEPDSDDQFSRRPCMCWFPGQVDSHVLCQADHFEIAEIVVQLVAVKVVDDLVGV